VSRNKGIMSENLKMEIAKEIGIFPAFSNQNINYEMASELGIASQPVSGSVYNTERPIDWGSVSSRDCGNMVKLAIQMAERSLGAR